MFFIIHDRGAYLLHDVCITIVIIFDPTEHQRQKVEWCQTEKVCRAITMNQRVRVDSQDSAWINQRNRARRQQFDLLAGHQVRFLVVKMVHRLRIRCCTAVNSYLGNFDNLSKKLLYLDPAWLTVKCKWFTLAFKAISIDDFNQKHSIFQRIDIESHHLSRASSKALYTYILIYTMNQNVSTYLPLSGFTRETAIGIFVFRFID